MIYNEDPGLVYDMLYFNIMYYNEENVRAANIPYLGKDTDLFAYRDELLKEITPPAQFSIMFYSRRGRTLFSLYLLQNFNPRQGTLRSMFQLVRNKEKFRRFIYFYFWDSLGDKLDFELFFQNDCETISKFLLYSDFPREILAEAANLFFHYDQTLEAFIEYMTDLSKKVKALRLRCANVIQAKMEIINTERFENIAKQYSGCKDSVNIHDQHYSVMLMYYFIVFYFWDSDRKSISFLFGIDSLDFIEKSIEYKHINPKLVGEMVFRDIKNEILIQLSIKDQTATQLSEILNVSRSSIGRHMAELHGELFIKEAKKVGHEIYFTLNIPYIEASKECVLNFYNNLLNGKGKYYGTTDKKMDKTQG